MILLLTGYFIGKPCGYCFVTYNEASSATDAIKKLNGYTLKNRQLTVKLAETPTSSKNTTSQQSLPVEKGSQIAAIEAKLKMMEKEETTSVKHRLLSSAKPPPLMSLDIKQPTEHVSRGKSTSTRLHGKVRTKPY